MWIGSVYGLRVRIQKAPEYGSNTDPDSQHCFSVWQGVGFEFFWLGSLVAIWFGFWRRFSLEYFHLSILFYSILLDIVTSVGTVFALILLPTSTCWYVKPPNKVRILPRVRIKNFLQYSAQWYGSGTLHIGPVVKCSQKPQQYGIYSTSVCNTS